MPRTLFRLLISPGRADAGHAAQRRRLAWSGLPLLALAVLAVHLGFLVVWQQPQKQPPRWPAHPAALQSRLVLQPADPGPRPATAPPPEVPVARPELRQTATLQGRAQAGPGAGTPPARPSADLGQTPAADPDRAVHAAGRVAGGLATHTRSGPPVAAGLAAAPPNPVAEPAVPDPTDDEASAPGSAQPLGEPPPVYAAQWPTAATLHYQMHYHGREGQARLTWLPDGDGYRLHLQGWAGAAGPSAAEGRGRQARRGPLIEQISQGRLASLGLVPERFTDRRLGRGLRAANFRHPEGRIEFSGPSHVFPAWLGVQDRLSWCVQLAAVVAAARAPMNEVRLFVVDAQGGGDIWRFLAQQHPADALALTQAAGLQHWRRDPLHPDGQQVDVWLDPALGHWPVHVLMTSLRTGSRFELRLHAGASSPP